VKRYKSDGQSEIAFENCYMWEEGRNRSSSTGAAIPGPVAHPNLPKLLSHRIIPVYTDLIIIVGVKLERHGKAKRVPSFLRR